jgi:sterol desaturase/sphingolipid hydroxylase (fatty acid hydroxylase superfamily)
MKPTLIRYIAPLYGDRGRGAKRGMKGYVMAVFLGLAGIAFFAFITASNDHKTIRIAAAEYHVKQACYKIARNVYSELIVQNQMLSWHFYAIVGIILLLEWTKPVYIRSGAFSVSFFFDFLWFLQNALFVSNIKPMYQRFLWQFYHSYLDFLQVDMINAWPLAGQILLAVLAADFTRWLHHLLRHKVMLFWHFHAVHHSQRDINLFTDLRVHPIDWLIVAGVSFIPFSSLRVNIALESFAGWYMFGLWYARFYHSNIKTNLGILRYIMVTPQSHRIHHSRKKEHQNKNYGAIFSIWDHLFGTQYQNYDEYPETGIDDAAFPHETELGWRATLDTLFLQLVYPFELAFRSVTGMVAPKRAAVSGIKSP